MLTLTKSKLSAFTRGATRLLCGGQAKASRFTTTGKGSTDKFPGDVVETMHSKLWFIFLHIFLSLNKIILELLKYKLARDNGEQYSLQDDNAAFQCCPKSAGQYDVYCNFKGGVPQPGTISYGSFGTDMSSAGRSWRRLHGAPLTARDESSAESSDEEDSDADLSSD